LLEALFKSGTTIILPIMATPNICKMSRAIPGLLILPTSPLILVEGEKAKFPDTALMSFCEDDVADIAPTILEILQLPIPVGGDSLLKPTEYEVKLLAPIRATFKK